MEIPEAIVEQLNLWEGDVAKWKIKSRDPPAVEIYFSRPSRPFHHGVEIIITH